MSDPEFLQTEVGAASQSLRRAREHCANCGAAGTLASHDVTEPGPGALASALAGEQAPRVIVQTVLLCPPCRHATHDWERALDIPVQLQALDGLLVAGGERRARLVTALRNLLPPHGETHRVADACVNLTGETVYYLATEFPEALAAEVIRAAQALVYLALAVRADERLGVRGTRH